MNRYKIPSEISCLVPIEKMDEGKFDIIISFTDKKSNNSVLFRRLKNNNINIISKPEEVQKITIKNEGFKLYLSEEQNIKPFRWDKGKQCTLLEIRSDQLDNSKARYYIMVDSIEFIRIIQQAKYIIDGEVGGTYSLDITNGIMKPVLENKLDEEYVEAKKTGEILSNNKFTKKWIPGHLYLTKQGLKILYLGNIKNIVVAENNWGPDKKYRFNLDTPLNTNYGNLIRYCETDDMMLVIEGFTLDSNKTERFDLESHKGETIETFLRSYYYSYIIPKTKYLSSFSVIRSKSIPGIDLGEYVKSSEDITTELKEFAGLLLSNIGEDEFNLIDSNSVKIRHLTSIFPEFISSDEKLKETITSNLIDSFKEELENSSYWKFYHKLPEVNDILISPKYRKIYYLRQVLKMSDEELTSKITKIIKEIKSGK